ncbi:MAG: Nif11-like leader peptide family RiPP precursor [Vicinamibacterales bacterium]|nr:Nif11-like leader peptide family RiPP precursor [Vicinamibacterales bacterium]
MTTDVVHAFLRHVSQSPDLLSQCRASLAGSSDPSVFVAMAHDCGFTFTQDDARAFFAEVLGSGPPEQLTDEQLSKVAGGKGGTKMPGSGSALRATVDVMQGLEPSRIPPWTSFR